MMKIDTLKLKKWIKYDFQKDVNLILLLSN